jgi:hypothetical protein
MADQQGGSPVLGCLILVVCLVAMVSQCGEGSEGFKPHGHPTDHDDRRHPEAPRPHPVR